MQDIADEIKRTVSVREILRIAGREVTSSGFCAIRDERTPSAKIYDHTNTWYDHGSGNGGSVIDLYMELYRVDVKCAIKELAHIAGIDRDNNYTPRQPLKSIANDSTSIVDDMTEEEQEFYYSRLGMLEDGENDVKVINQVRELRIYSNQEVFEELARYCRLKVNRKAMQYLIKSRKFNDETINTFRLFTIDNYNEVDNHMKKAFELPRLQKCGLYNQKENGDGNLIFYKHLVQIPYLRKGKIVYLRGRYFDKEGNLSCDKGFKYLGLRNDLLNVNTPKRFFNIDLLDNIHKGAKINITEGEFDAMAVYQLRFNALAIPGTGNMPRVQMLKRLSDWDIVICVDNDIAGNDLEVKLGGALESLNIDYRVKILPTKDANQFLMEFS